MPSPLDTIAVANSLPLICDVTRGGHRVVAYEGIPSSVYSVYFNGMPIEYLEKVVDRHSSAALGWGYNPVQDTLHFNQWYSEPDYGARNGSVATLPGGMYTGAKSFSLALYDAIALYTGNEISGALLANSLTPDMIDFAMVCPVDPGSNVAPTIPGAASLLFPCQIDDVEQQVLVFFNLKALCRAAKLDYGATWGTRPGGARITATNLITVAWSIVGNPTFGAFFSSSLSRSPVAYQDGILYFGSCFGVPNDVAVTVPASDYLHFEFATSRLKVGVEEYFAETGYSVTQEVTDALDEVDVSKRLLLTVCSSVKYGPTDITVGSQLFGGAPLKEVSSLVLTSRAEDSSLSEDWRVSNVQGRVRKLETSAFATAKFIQFPTYIALAITDSTHNWLVGPTQIPWTGSFEDLEASIVSRIEMDKPTIVEQIFSSNHPDKQSILSELEILDEYATALGGRAEFAYTGNVDDWIRCFGHLKSMTTLSFALESLALDFTHYLGQVSLREAGVLISSVKSVNLAANI